MPSLQCWGEFIPVRSSPDVTRNIAPINDTFHTARHVPAAQLPSPATVPSVNRALWALTALAAASTASVAIAYTVCGGATDLVHCQCACCIAAEHSQEQEWRAAEGQVAQFGQVQAHHAQRDPAAATQDLWPLAQEVRSRCEWWEPLWHGQWQVGAQNAMQHRPCIPIQTPK